MERSHTPQNVSPVNAFTLERVVVFNTPNFMELSYLSTQLFRPMFLQKKFVLTFQKLDITFLTSILLHTKQLLVKNHINCLVIRKRFLSTLHPDSFLAYI